MSLPCSSCGRAIPRDFKAGGEGEDLLCPRCFREKVDACQFCGNPGVGEVEIRRIQGLIILGRQGSKRACLCTDCARGFVMRSLAYTAVWGWYGVLPFFKSLSAQAVNLRSLARTGSLSPVLLPPVALFAYFVPLAAAALVLVLLITGGKGDLPSLSSEAMEAARAGAQAQRGRDYVKALSYFHVAVEEEPNYPPYRFSLGVTLQRLERFEEAEVQLRKGLELAGSPKPAREAQSLADVLAALGRHDEAAQIYLEVIGLWDRDTMTPAAPRRRFLCLAHRGVQRETMRSGKPHDLLRTYRTLADKNPGSAMYQYLAGAVEEEAPLKEARYRAALKADPEFFEAGFALAWLHRDQGRFALALEQADRMLGARAGRVKLLTFKGEVSLLSASWKNAEDIFAQARRIAPKRPNGWVGQAWCDLEQGGFAKALKQFREASERFQPRGYWADSIALGSGLGKLGLGEDGNDELSRAAGSLTPDLADRAKMWLGAALVLAGKDPDEAWNSAPKTRSDQFEALTLSMLSGRLPRAEYQSTVSAERYQPYAARASFFLYVRLTQEEKVEEAEVFRAETQGLAPPESLLSVLSKRK